MLGVALTDYSLYTNISIVIPRRRTVSISHLTVLFIPLLRCFTFGTQKILLGFGGRRLLGYLQNYIIKGYHVYVLQPKLSFRCYPYTECVEGGYCHDAPDVMMLSYQ